MQFTPTLLFLDEKGAVALRLNGYQPPDRFRVALDYVRLHRETSESFTEYLTANPPPATGPRRTVKSGAKSGAMSPPARICARR